MEDIYRFVAILYSPSSILVGKNGGVRRVTLPLGTACKAGASLFSHGPTKLASRLGAAPSKLSFGDSTAQAGARLKKLVRLPGVAPGHAPWREAILLLNHNRVTS